MLKSILKNNYPHELNIGRVTTKKNLYNYKIIFLVGFTLISFSLLFINRYNLKEYKIIESKIFNEILIDSGFTLKNIEIFGNKNLPKSTIVEIINSENKSNIFAINLSNIHNKIIVNDWVRYIDIERILPNTIKIKVKENYPIAIWQQGTNNKLITKDGKTISTENLNKFKSNLPIINGNNANKNINTILKIINRNEVFSKNIWSLTYINNRRWNINLNQGLVVLLPSTGVLSAWEKIIKLQKNYDVLNLGLTELDLRFPNQILGKINFDKKLITHRKSL